MTDTTTDTTTGTTIRLAIDIGPLYGHRTGVATAVDGVVEALSSRSDVVLDPYLVSFRSSPSDRHRKLPLPGIVASHFWSRSDHPSADRWLRDADVVHGTNYVAPPSSIPTVVSVYDCWFLRHPRQAAPVVRRAGRMLRRAAERWAWIHATSTATAAEVTDLLRTDRVRTVFLGAPPVVADDGARPVVAADLGGRRYIVAVATEERRKGLPLLVQAFEHLAGDHPDLLLVLAGARGDDSPALGKLIDKAGPATASRIHRLGVVDDTTKHWLVRHAAVLAYPSLDEGFGFPILEAQAAGTPVVATRVGSIPEIAGDSASLVDDRDPIGFAEALDQVLSSGATRLGLIEAGYRNVRRFNWATTAERLVELYRDTLDSHT